MLRQRAADRDELEHRTGLVDIGDRAVRSDLGVDPSRVVRVVAGGLRHREHIAGVRVEHDRRSGARAVVGDGLAKNGLGVRLHALVDGGEHVLALTCGLRADDVDRPPDGRPHDRLLAGPPGELLVELELEAAEAVVVRAREADHLRRDRVLRVEPLLLRVRVDAREGFARNAAAALGSANRCT